MRSVRNKLHRDRVNTMPGILFRKTLTFKNMPKVCIAVGAHNFYPMAVCIRPRLRISHDTWRLSAPRAMRTPISAVRCVTEYAMTA